MEPHLFNSLHMNFKNNSNEHYHYTSFITYLLGIKREEKKKMNTKMYARTHKIFINQY